jgi:hypothetical protein
MKNRESPPTETSLHPAIAHRAALVAVERYASDLADLSRLEPGIAFEVQYAATTAFRERLVTAALGIPAPIVHAIGEKHGPWWPLSVMHLADDELSGALEANGVTHPCGMYTPDCEYLRWVAELSDGPDTRSAS